METIGRISPGLGLAHGPGVATFLGKVQCVSFLSSSLATNSRTRN